MLRLSRRPTIYAACSLLVFPGRQSVGLGAGNAASRGIHFMCFNVARPNETLLRDLAVPAIRIAGWFGKPRVR